MDFQQDKTFISVLSELLGKERKTSIKEEDEERKETAMSQLFSKGSSSANEMAEIWDDTALIRMYEESISSAYKAVVPGSGASKSAKKDSKVQVKREQTGWSVGDRCAAPYEEEDGNKLWYPATITRIGPSSFEVCFDGYEGTETVPVEELYPEEELEGEQNEEASNGESEAMELSHSVEVASSSAGGSRKRTNGGGKGGRREGGGGGWEGGRGGEGFRAPIPSLAPPPPPSFTSLPRPNEDDALSSMLMSWYMSGYHTGYYQAMQDMKNGKK